MIIFIYNIKYTPKSSQVTNITMITIIFYNLLTQNMSYDKFSVTFVYRNKYICNSIFTYYAYNIHATVSEILS